MAGMTTLEANIARLNAATADLRAAIRDGHALLKDMRAERREIEQLIGPTAKEAVDERVADLVKQELDRIGPMLKENSHAIYAKVGHQVDLLIDLAMGKAFAKKHDREDLRPLLAEKLGEWIRQELDRV